ncbi:MAG: YcfL family protein [Proteobacteria bacterium]|nr:YcfL family protein [Pseudomonadota bacterium]
MKKYLASGVLLAAVLGFSAMAQAASISLTDRVDQLGEMKYLKLVTGRTAQRNGLLVVQVEMKNQDKGNQQLYYRFRWLDEAGLEVGGEEAWKPFKFIGLQKRTIESIAPVPNAVDFKMEVNSPDNTGAEPAAK